MKDKREIQYDCQPSQSRANKINQGIGILNYQQNEYMQQFDFRVSNEVAITQARILPAPNYSIILLLEIVQEMVYGL
jgi:eukaryotic translation initiation factor 2C